MEELALFLVELLLELFLQIFLEILFEFGSASYKETYQRPNRHIVIAALGYFFAGVAVGGLSLLFWPNRFFRPGPIPGLSLILSPLAAGATMHAWGELRRRSGRVTTNLATFAGGAAFAFGTALVRFLCAK